MGRRNYNPRSTFCILLVLTLGLTAVFSNPAGGPSARDALKRSAKQTANSVGGGFARAGEGFVSAGAGILDGAAGVVSAVGQGARTVVLGAAAAGEMMGEGLTSLGRACAAAVGGGGRDCDSEDESFIEDNGSEFEEWDEEEPVQSRRPARSRPRVQSDYEEFEEQEPPRRRMSAQPQPVARPPAAPVLVPQHPIRPYFPATNKYMIQKGKWRLTGNNFDVFYDQNGHLFKWAQLKTDGIVSYAANFNLYNGGHYGSVKASSFPFRAKFEFYGEILGRVADWYGRMRPKLSLFGGRKYDMTVYTDKARLLAYAFYRFSTNIRRTKYELYQMEADGKSKKAHVATARLVRKSSPKQWALTVHNPHALPLSAIVMMITSVNR